MLGWLGIFAGLGSWAKESYDRNHVKYSSPQAEKYFTQKTKKDIGFERMMADLDTVPREERDRRRALGYYDGENVDISDKTKDPNHDFFEQLQDFTRKTDILILDGHTKDEAINCLVNGTKVFDDFEERFDYYMQELSIRPENILKYQEMVKSKIPISGWSIVENYGKIYYIKYTI